MKKALFLVFTLAFSALAVAHEYKWVDQNGKVQYGDAPPAGVNATRLGAVPAPTANPSGAAKSEDAKAAKKGPLTPADQEAEFRKRQQEAGKEREKQALAAQEAEVKKENCARAREGLRTFESGQRISRTKSDGERYFLDDAQTAQETAKARQNVQQWCN